MGIFSAFIQGVNERFHDLLGWSHDSVTSLMIWPLYEVLMERTVRLINRDVTGLIICSGCSMLVSLCCFWILYSLPCILIGMCSQKLRFTNIQTL
jgi:hypothetical protein